MRRKHIPYQCPRCGYNSPKKWDMHRHLYGRTTQCQGEIEDIELTDDIKAGIMKNRIYHRPKEPPPPPTINIHGLINQFNSFNNMVSSIDLIDRLKHLTEFRNMSITDFETSVEKKYSQIAKKLDTNSYKLGFEINHEDMLETIDEVSNTNRDLQNFNIIYDSSVDKIKIYDGEWEEFISGKGVRKILTTIKDYYWDAYECYLLRKVALSKNAFEKQRCRELLQEYYKFICCFEIYPFCKDHSDGEILGDPTKNNAYEVSEQYYSLYAKERDAISKAKSILKEKKKQVVDIIKKNTERNIKHLNHEVYNMFSMEEGFRNIIMSSVKGILPKDLESSLALCEPM